MADKLLKYDVAMKSTKTVWQMETPRCYTGDENTVTFDFNITDLEAADLVGVIPNVYLYMRDGSFFQNGPADGVEITGTIVNYTMKGNEGKHSGIAKAQLVLVWDDEVNPAEKLTSQLYVFEVVSGLENKVAVEVMIQDWTTLTREARTFIDTSSDEVDALKGELQTAINTANTSLGEFDVALQNGIVATNIAAELQNLEETYAPDLVSVKSQLADIDSQVDLLNRGLGETFATLTDLQTVYPTGDIKDHIVGADGHRYFWNETTAAWADGGAYQAVEVASGAVSLPKLSTSLQADIDYFNTFSAVPFTQNMGSFYSRFSGVLKVSAFFEYADIVASAGDIFYVTLRTGSNVAGVIFRDASGAVLSMLYADGVDVVITDQKIVAPYGTARISLSSRNNTNPLQIKKANTFGQLKAGAIIGDKSITYTKMSDDLVAYLGYKPFGYIEKAAVVFVCDDGEQETLTYLPSISTSKNVPFVSACWTDSVILNASNLATTQGLIASNGWEIAMHYNTHLNALTADQVLNIFATEKTNLTAKGLTIKNFVYPYNETTALLQLLCSKYFNIAAAGTLADPWKENKKRSNLFNMSRRKIQGATGLSAYQTMIDGAVANKQILIFYFHGIELNTAENLARLNEVIDYCKTKDMTITTLQGLYDM